MFQIFIPNTKNILGFLEKILTISKSSKEEFNKFDDDWKEDDSPPFTSLFSYIGSAIIKDFDLLSNEEKFNLFSHIELGINSEDEYLATAVATGLVEALVDGTYDKPELWNEIEDYLGSESKKHAVAWKNFGQ